MTTLARRQLGATSVEVPVVGFGAASLGNLYRPVSDDDARAALERALDCGMAYVDTAPFYGLGLSERRVGDVLRQRPRDSFVLSTKVGRLLMPDDTVYGDAERYGFCSNLPFRPVYDYSHDGIMRSFEASLQRLGLARIDILFVHDIGELTHGAEGNVRHWRDFVDGGLRALERLRSEGSVGAIGLGVNETAVCEKAMEVGQFDCFLLAGRYTLLEQGALETFLPKCAEHGASVIAGGIYNSGILATGIREGQVPYYNYAPAPDHVIDRVRQIEAICARHRVALADAALQFPLAHPQVACVIPGMGSPRRIDAAMQQHDAQIPVALWSDLMAAQLIDHRAPVP